MILKTIALAGMMGSGKTSVGKQLSQLINYLHCDLDSYIEKHTELSITQLIQINGFEHFRILEKYYLEQCLKNLKPPTVLSLGGGSLTLLPEQHSLFDQCLVVYLQTSTEELTQRLENETEQRPLLRGLRSAKLKKTLEDLLIYRSAQFEKAHITINTDSKTVMQICLQLLEKINAYEN